MTVFIKSDNGVVRRVLLAGILLASLALLSACSQHPTPEERFQSYIATWEQQDFTDMYARLAQESKENITEEAFVERHENIYSGIEADKIKITPNVPEELIPDDDGQVHISFELTMETLAGPVSFTHEGTLIEEERDESKDWYVVWNEQMIFPKLGPDDEIRAETLPAERGEIRDRNGNGLAINGVSVGIVPERLGDNPAEAKQNLADLLHMSVDQIESKLNASWVQPHYFVPIAPVSPNDVGRLTGLKAIPGVAVQDSGNPNIPQRVYPYGEVAAHLTGYVRPITDEELKELEDQDYNAGDFIGKSGLENVLETRLRGENGGVIYTTDADGNRLETIAERPARDGEDIRLTIDMDMQTALYEQLEGDAGTAAALHPKTGEVLSLVNSPAYDPNLFVRGLTSEKWDAWQADPKKPLLNRFSQRYAPGSAFKPITAVIGLKTGAITPEQERDIDDKQWQAGPSWGNYFVTRVSDPGEPVNLQEAFVLSDNIYFAQTALDIGADAFLKEAEAFGFGEAMPFSYPIEPSQLGRDGEIGTDIQLADTGYGQGQVAMSALHLALTYTPLVNEGDLLTPVLLSTDGQAEAEVWHEAIMQPEVADLLLDYLLQVVEHPRGTGKEAQISGIAIAGKTGTAELKRSQTESGKENGWFVGLNTEDPQLLVVMMIEDVQGRGGSHYVVPKVRDVMEKFLK